MADECNAVPKRVRAGNLDALKRKLWRALLTSETLLDSTDPQVRLRAVHATSQAAGVYRNIYETADLEQRIIALEQAQNGRDDES
jgi:hypothetical protein